MKSTQVPEPWKDLLSQSADWKCCFLVLLSPIRGRTDPESHNPLQSGREYQFRSGPQVLWEQVYLRTSHSAVLSAETLLDQIQITWPQILTDIPLTTAWCWFLFTLDFLLQVLSIIHTCTRHQVENPPAETSSTSQSPRLSELTQTSSKSLLDFRLLLRSPTGITVLEVLECQSWSLEQQKHWQLPQALNADLDTWTGNFDH